MAKRIWLAALALMLTLGFAPGALADDDDDDDGPAYRLQVLSSPPDMVTGGDALVRLTVRAASSARSRSSSMGTT